MSTLEKICEVLACQPW
ncbi:hypothetical protein [Bacillus sp. mrc49]